MSRPVLPAGHGRAAVLQLGRRVAAELASEALDPTADLTMAHRMALASLSLAVDAEASRRAGVEPLAAEALPLLAAELARIERQLITPESTPSVSAGGQPRGIHHADA